MSDNISRTHSLKLEGKRVVTQHQKTTAVFDKFSVNNTLLVIRYRLGVVTLLYNNNPLRCFADILEASGKIKGHTLTFNRCLPSFYKK